MAAAAVLPAALGPAALSPSFPVAAVPLAERKRLRLLAFENGPRD
jgi:hypothetical protein